MAVVRRLRAFIFIVSALLPLAAFAAEKPRVQVDSYAINAELNPKTHHLIAAARLKFTALDDIGSASFELNNALRPRVLDSAGKPLAIERISQENLVRVNFPKPLAKGDSNTITNSGAITVGNGGTGIDVSSSGGSNSIINTGTRAPPGPATSTRGP